jgi:uncharacterized protein YkwD
MRHFSRLLSGILVLCLSLFLLAGCAPAAEDEMLTEEAMLAQEIRQLREDLQTLQGTYDTLSANYSTARNEIEVIQAKYEELTTEYTELNTTYDELDTMHDDLTTQYNELSVQYNIVMQGGITINEEDVEQAILDLINQERQNNGLDSLEWTKSLYSWAEEHSEYMAVEKSLEYSTYPSWQEIFRAAGYPTAERIANAALIIWKENSLQYESNFLNVGARYGVVAASKSGDVFYIIYMAQSTK